LKRHQYDTRDLYNESIDFVRNLLAKERKQQRTAFNDDRERRIQELYDENRELKEKLGSL
jgi:hypothetical protein